METDRISRLLARDPLMCYYEVVAALGYRGANCSQPMSIPSQMNPQTCTNVGANRSSRVAAFLDLNL